MSEEDLLDRLIERIAEAVVQKMEERRKIDLIAEAVLARLEEREQAGGQEGPVGEVGGGRGAKLRGKKAAKRGGSRKGEEGKG